jgi:hypothetical protein
LSNDSAPHPGGLLLHHDEDGFLEALELLIDSGRVTTADALVRYAESAREPHAAEYLRNLDSEGLPLQLVFDAFSVHARIVAHKRNSGLLRDIQGKKVGLVMPLPPHVVDGFLGLSNLVVITPDGHPLPPPLRRRALTEHKGSRAGRKMVSGLEVVIFEAFRKGGEYYLDPAVADVVDPRILPADSRLVIHLRPHANPDDVPLGATQTISTL